MSNVFDILSIDECTNSLLDPYLDGQKYRM